MQFSVKSVNSNLQTVFQQLASTRPDCKLGQKSNSVFQKIYFFQIIFEPPEIHSPFIIVALKVETGRFFEMS